MIVDTVANFGYWTEEAEMKKSENEKMVATEKEIQAGNAKLEGFFDRQRVLGEFKATTNAGAEAQKKAIEVISKEIYTVKEQVSKLRERLEVETIEYLASGEETVGDQPTGSKKYIFEKVSAS